nr:MAG TPA: RNA polymerase-like protein [Caudoviricetes sp.]
MKNSENSRTPAPAGQSIGECSTPQRNLQR